MPEKPEALILLEQCEALNLPLVAGGLMDQPHIWLILVAVIREEKRLFELANKRSQGAEHGKDK